MPKKVVAREVYPVSLGLVLFPPFFAERRKHRNRSTVLVSICQPASSSQSAKADGVFAMDLDVHGVNGKDCVGRGVVADPEKCLLPRIFRRGPGPFNMCARRKKRALCHEHSGA